MTMSPQHTYVQLAPEAVATRATTAWTSEAITMATVREGNRRVLLVADAHTTGTLELEDGTILEAAHVIRELNVAMTGLSYPGRTNGTARAADVDFATPGGVCS